MTGNLLAAETSPYLLQHKDNPVHWRPWGDAAFAEARRDNKPVLLSVGYAACHWCHVMAHESFEDPTTADLMNRLFVNIKVDREERPDVDALYQSALALIGVQGGWPLTMFLTPKREPFWGGTYFPPATKYGRPSFHDVLGRVAEVFHEDQEGIAHNVAALRDSLERMARPQTAGTPALGAIDTAAENAFRQVDLRHGDTLGAPKFPQPSLFRLLWTAHLRTGRPEYRDAVVTTLVHLSQGGIYDHLGGGYARYSTDDVWLVPHFEKMLYDNAQILGLLTDVWLKTRNPLFATRARETVSWMLRDMRVAEDGHVAAFASAVDADSAGEEGRYYVWSEAEIDAALGQDSDFFKAIYDVKPGGNWEGHTILHRLASSAPGSEADERKLASCRLRLLAVRGQRVPPLRDDKVLAEWNGLAIAALARASIAFDEPPWLEAATAAFAFVRDRMSVEGGGLHRSWRAGRPRHAAVLEDYGAMILAGLALFEANGNAAALAQAESWADTVEWSFRDSADGGYFQTAAETVDILVRSKPFLDNALPSGNGLMAEALAKLFHLTGRDVYRHRAEALIAAFAGAADELLAHIPHILIGHALLENPVQAVIVGGPQAADTQALRRAVLDAAGPHVVMLQVPPGAELPPEHPAHGRSTVEGRAAAYVCRNFACGLPVTDPDHLRADLTRM